MCDIIIRNYQVGDEGKVLELWNECLPFDPVDRENFVLKVFLDPNFDKAGFKLAFHKGVLVGFVLSFIRNFTSWNYPLEKDKGWITSICVDPLFRRQGIGSLLIGEAIKYIKGEGRNSVVVSNYFPSYFFPGVNAKSYPGSLDFFHSLRFSIVKKVPGMGRDLYDFVWPPEAIRMRKELSDQGIICDELSQDCIPCVIDFLKEHFPQWCYYFWTKLVRNDALSEVIIARKNEIVIGYCQQFYGDHVGPFGVGSNYRGRGIGTIILFSLLERMKQRGFKYAWFSSAEPDSVNYYLRAGFRITREYCIMNRDLD